MKRFARSILFSGTLVGSGYLGLRLGKKDTVLDLEIPQPLPDVENSSNEELLFDTVNRYSRMAPVYDGLLDKVENKYQGFELREKLLKQAHGHVLEIGVGTARNIQFYDNSCVQSITYVDSTYPMLNAALVKVNDLYSMHDNNGVLIAANQSFSFPVIPTKSLIELQQEWIAEKKAQMLAASDDPSIASNPILTSLNTANMSLNNSVYPIHTTFRPQLLLPIISTPTDASDTDPIAGSTPSATSLSPEQFQTAIQLFPQRIRELFQSTNPEHIKISSMSTLAIEDEEEAGERILDHTRDVLHPNTDSSVDPHFPHRKLPPNVSPSKQEKERQEKRAAILKEHLLGGQEWKTMTKAKNVIPSAFIHLDAHDLSFFPTNSYDTVVDTFGLCSFHHPVDVLREIRRVCKPGGKVLLLEHGLGTSWAMNQVIYKTNDSHKKQWGCDRSKDIVQILTEAGYDAKLLERRHGGTTLVYDGKPPKAPQELANNQYFDFKVVKKPVSFEELTEQIGSIN